MGNRVSENGRLSYCPDSKIVVTTGDSQDSMGSFDFTQTDLWKPDLKDDTLLGLNMEPLNGRFSFKKGELEGYCSKNMKSVLNPGDKIRFLKSMKQVEVQKGA